MLSLWIVLALFSGTEMLSEEGKMTMFSRKNLEQVYIATVAQKQAELEKQKRHQIFIRLQQDTNGVKILGGKRPVVSKNLLVDAETLKIGRIKVAGKITHLNITQSSVSQRSAAMGKQVQINSIIVE